MYDQKKHKNIPSDTYAFMRELIEEILQEEDLQESLHDWFKKEKWVRITTSGDIAGPCGTSKNKKNPDRCLPKAKAKSLTKGQRAATAIKKKKAGAKGKQVVPNTKKAKVKKEEVVAEKKDDRCTRIAKREYDTWPSALASGAVVRCRSGKIWKDLKEEELREIIREVIRKVGGKYAVYPKKGGKRLGTHSTRKAAEKQLAAIHINKESAGEEFVDIKYYDKVGAVLATVGDKKVGALRVKPFKDGYQVDSVLVSPEYRGHGIGKEMYRTAFEELGTLYSDAQQTSDATALWKSLVSSGEAEETQGGYKMIKEGAHDPMNPGILKKRLGKLSCSKVRKERQGLKDKGTTYAKALQRYLNYHCQ